MTKKTKTAKKKAAAPRKASKAKGNHVGATTAAILGMASTPDRGKKKKSEPPVFGKVKVKQEWTKYYQILLDLRERLLEQMDGLAKESAEQMSSYSLHMADSGTDNFDRDFALSLLSSDQDAIYEIEEALRRIERNTYGICELTGKNIPKARLTAIPWTRFTVEAQAQLERDGALRSRRLGSLGTIDSTGGSDSDDDYDSDDKSPSSSKDKED